MKIPKHTKNSLAAAHTKITIPSLTQTQQIAAIINILNNHSRLTLNELTYKRYSTTFNHYSKRMLKCLEFQLLCLRQPGYLLKMAARSHSLFCQFTFRC